MKNGGLLLVERLILEALEKKPLTSYQIVKETKLNPQLVGNLLSHLVQRNFLIFKDSTYTINYSDHLKKTLRNTDEIQAEVRELLGSFVNYYFLKENPKTKLNVRKVYLTFSEEKELERRFQDIEQFLFQVEQNRKYKPLKEPLYKKEMLIWGKGNYTKVVDNFLQAI